MLNKKTIEDIDVNGKRVLVRCDFNVPLQDGKITDETLVKVENFVNDYIKNSYKRETTIKNLSDIDTNEVMALFADKYKDKVDFKKGSSALGLESRYYIIETDSGSKQ